MTRAKLAAFGALALFAAGGLAAGVWALASRFLNSKPAATVVMCGAAQNTHTVAIQNARLSAPDVRAKLCDKLTIVNDDPTLRLMAFGLHDHHQPYDGVTEQVLPQGQSLSVTLNQAGTFTFHDHIHDEVQGTFTVE